MSRLLLAAALLFPSVALAVPQCATDDHRAQLGDFAEKLRGSDSVEQAQELAIAKISLTERAVRQAVKIVPNDVELLEHQHQLQAFRAGVEDARTQEQVAQRFSTLQGQQMGGSCHFSTGEVIAIVLGFILGIIPGIILLILLC
jgi:capsular polysaccharide biosynthesis protein